MAEIYVQNGSEIAIKATYAGREVVNVLHFVNDEAAVSDADKARDILNAWQGQVMSVLDQSYVLTGAVWRSLDPDDTNQGTLAPDNTKPLTGWKTGTGSHPGVAMLVKKVTNNRQRGQRDGRMFLAGVPAVNVQESGALTSDLLGEANTAMAAFLDAVNDDAFGVGGGSGLIVLNTTPESRLPGSTPVTLGYRTVGSLVVDPKVATQRDRLR